jgi:sugar/nucleoside kinase (ribokinase family)
MSRLVHAGSAVADYVYRLDALPSPGTEKIAKSYHRVAGGGFNMMVAASRTGMLVARFSQIVGYRCLSLIRASIVVNRQSALAW